MEIASMRMRKHMPFKLIAYTIEKCLAHKIIRNKNLMRFELRRKKQSILFDVK